MTRRSVVEGKKVMDNAAFLAVRSLKDNYALALQFLMEHDNAKELRKSFFVEFKEFAQQVALDKSDIEAQADNFIVIRNKQGEKSRLAAKNK